MNIKSLLFGSAAALVAVSGARAADAVVVAEPEPAEYVKICDVYGAGYFYIPGTETCLRIGGYVRYDAGFGDLLGGKAVDHLDPTKVNDTWKKNARFTLKTWTGQETELGTLKTYTETRWNFGGTDVAYDKGVTLNFAWVQLGGLRVGKDESAWDTFTGYAGNVINDSLIGYGGEFDTNLISYTMDAGNGFSGIISLEQGSGAYTIDSYVPHVVVGAKYTQAWGGIVGVGAYDSAQEEWAGKVRVDVNATEQLSLFVMGAYGSEKNGTYNFFKNWDGKWGIWGGATYKVNEKVSVNGQVSYDSGKDVAVVANVSYEVVPGFTITPEVAYWNHTDTNKYGVKDDAWGGMIRFQRNF